MKYDFTEEAQPPLEFKIGPDVFYAVRDCPAGTIVDLAQMVRAADGSDKLQAVMKFFDQVLRSESIERFAQRIRSADQPITFKVLMAVFEALLGEYTAEVRPTEAASSSQNGLTETAQPSKERVSLIQDGTHLAAVSRLASTEPTSSS